MTVTDIAYQATAIASLVTFSALGLWLRQKLGQLDARRRERRR